MPTGVTVGSMSAMGHFCLSPPSGVSTQRRVEHWMRILSRWLISIDALCTREFNDRQIRPKVIA